jgi:hypothetical protein
MRYNVPFGTVVVLTATSHLGNVGMAAYAGDVVHAFGKIQGAYGKVVRLVHSYPLILGRGLQTTARSGAEVDRAMAGRGGQTLPRPSPSDLGLFHQKLPHLSNKKQQLHLHLPSGTKASFLTALGQQYCLYQSGVGRPARVPSHPGGGDEQFFLGVMIEELNNKLLASWS